MDIDLMFRNWSLTFQYTKQFTQLGCTADLITGLHAEPLTESGLKNLICDIKPVTMSIKNYVITEVTANMAGYKATDACLNRVRQFYSQRPFFVPAQRVEVWPIKPKYYTLIQDVVIVAAQSDQNVQSHAISALGASQPYTNLMFKIQ
ncbi:MAG: hypothetical protein EZS28_015147 [Streblomastix strix]|uniref:Uncharacterized protein n=1 Tax=Streblomastix strix TaxID=222440 RepID=A0A5J4W366_9EUKA|nr:MAG: hypothetical protein EZS28_015147 [Streblomastix strix]